MYYNIRSKKYVVKICNEKWQKNVCENAMCWILFDQKPIVNAEMSLWRILSRIKFFLFLFFIRILKILKNTFNERNNERKIETEKEFLGSNP